MGLFGSSDKTRSLDDLDPSGISSMLTDKLSELSAKFDALWFLAKEKLQLSDADLEAALAKVQNKPTIPKNGTSSTDVAVGPCPKCGRARSAKTGLCPYCGGDEASVTEALKRFESQS